MCFQDQTSYLRAERGRACACLGTVRAALYFIVFEMSIKMHLPSRKTALPLWNQGCLWLRKSFTLINNRAPLWVLGLLCQLPVSAGHFTGFSLDLRHFTKPFSITCSRKTPKRQRLCIFSGTITDFQEVTCYRPSMQTSFLGPPNFSLEES